MKRTPLSLLLLPLLLASCGERPSFGNWRDDRLPYFDRNGDNFVATGRNSVNEMTVAVEGSDLIPLIERGESFFLCFSRESCSHCQAIADDFVSFLKESNLQVYRNEMRYFNSMAEFVSHYPDADLSAISSHYETPAFFFVEAIENQPKATYFYVPDLPSDYSSYFAKRFNRTEIYHFEDEENLKEALKKEDDVLVYYESEEGSPLYEKLILPLAKQSNKPLYFASKKMACEEKGRLKRYKKTSTSSMEVISTESFSLERESEIKQLLADYFG